MNAPLPAERITSVRQVDNSDGTAESWWFEKSTHHRGVAITTRVKVMQSPVGDITAQDVSIRISDGRSPRQFSIPVGVLDEVIAALTSARANALLVEIQLTAIPADNLGGQHVKPRS